MCTFDGWAERNHIEPRIFIQEKSAFQSGMDSPHNRFVAEKIGIDVFGYIKISESVSVPSRITVGMCDFAPPSGRVPVSVGNIAFGRIDRTSLTCGDQNIPFFRQTFTDARLVEVSTRSSISWLHSMTPLGQAYRLFRSLC